MLWRCLSHTCGQMSLYSLSNPEPSYWATLWLQTCPHPLEAEISSLIHKGDGTKCSVGVHNSQKLLFILWISCFPICKAAEMAPSSQSCDRQCKWVQNTPRILGTLVDFNYGGSTVPLGLPLGLYQCCPRSQRRVWVSLGASHSLSPQWQLFHLFSAEIGWEQGGPHIQGPSWNKAACEIERVMNRAHKCLRPHLSLSWWMANPCHCLTFLITLSWYCVTCKMWFL